MINIVIGSIVLFLLVACTSTVCYNGNEYEQNRHQQYQKVGKCEK